MQVYLFGDYYGFGSECKVTGINMVDYIRQVVDDVKDSDTIDLFIENSYSKCLGGERQLYAICNVLSKFSDYKHQNARVHQIDYQDTLTAEQYQKLLSIDNKPIIVTYMEMGAPRYAQYVKRKVRQSIMNQFNDKESRLYKQHFNISDQRLISDLCYFCMNFNDATLEKYISSLTADEKIGRIPNADRIFNIIETMYLISEQIFVQLYAMFKLFRRFKLKRGEDERHAQCHRAIFYTDTNHAQTIYDTLMKLDYLRPHSTINMHQIIINPNGAPLRCIELPHIVTSFMWSRAIIKSEPVSKLSKEVRAQISNIHLINIPINYNTYVAYVYAHGIAHMRAYLIYNLYQWFNTLEIFDLDDVTNSEYLYVLIEHLLYKYDYEINTSFTMSARANATNHMLIQVLKKCGFKENAVDGAHIYFVRQARHKPLTHALVTYDSSKSEHLGTWWEPS